MREDIRGQATMWEDFGHPHELSAIWKHIDAGWIHPRSHVTQLWTYPGPFCGRVHPWLDTSRAWNNTMKLGLFRINLPGLGINPNSVPNSWGQDLIRDTRRIGARINRGCCICWTKTKKEDGKDSGEDNVDEADKDNGEGANTSKDRKRAQHEAYSWGALRENHVSGKKKSNWHWENHSDDMVELLCATTTAATLSTEYSPLKFRQTLKFVRAKKSTSVRLECATTEFKTGIYAKKEFINHANKPYYLKGLALCDKLRNHPGRCWVTRLRLGHPITAEVQPFNDEEMDLGTGSEADEVEADN
ncbi:hypothetical protein K438DRAFT_1790363 [Mycena galopus ATCC 62051]|nr:hypothetical protein K438DRAFT_1790363 [Mycena galopus ATCC 62051]